MTAILRDSTVAVVRTRPQAIPLAMITTRKSIHGFPLVFYMAMGLRFAAAGAPLSTNNAGCNGGIKELWTGMVARTSFSPLPAERLSGSYIQWFAYKYAIPEEGLCKNCVFERTFLVYRGEIKGSETFLMLVFYERKLILHEDITAAYH